MNPSVSINQTAIQTNDDCEAQALRCIAWLSFAEHIQEIQHATDEVKATCVAMDAVCKLGRESLNEPMTI